MRRPLAFRARWLRALDASPAGTLRARNGERPPVASPALRSLQRSLSFPSLRSESSMPDAPAESLYLLDAHSLIYQVFHAIAAMSSPSGLPTNAVFGFTRDLFFIREKNPTSMIAVFDAPGKTFRDAIF